MDKNEIKEEFYELVNKGVEKEEAKKKMFHRVFKSLCPKSYLNECEPEFCAFRIEGSCPVINLIEELIDEFE